MADDKLSTVQEKALDLILKNYKRADGGMTIEEIAKAVKRSRQTVSSWMNHHKLFRSEYDRRICELNKYATAYQDKENAIWEATLNVATTTNGEKILYDINPIRMVEQPVKSGTISTNTSVTQSNSAVNTQSMQNNKKNTQRGSNSIPSIGRCTGEASAPTRRLKTTLFLTGFHSPSHLISGTRVRSSMSI